MESWVLAVTICCLVCATIYGGRRVSLRPPSKTRYLDELSNLINGFSDDCGSMAIGINQCQLLRFQCLRVLQRPRRDSIVIESFCAIRRALKLMQDCCSENWILKAAEFGNCQRHFLEILLDLHTLPIVVNRIRFGGESLDDMATEFRSIDISEETKLAISEAWMRDMAALRRKLVRGHWLADQLEAKAIPGLIAPDEIGRCVTKYNFLRSPPPIHADANNGICVFRATCCSKQFVIKARFSKPGAIEQEEIILRKEASFMKKCRHPYAAALLGYWDFTRTEGLFELTRVPLLLMESMECDLDSIIKGNKIWWWWPWGGTGGFPALDAINLVLPVAKVMKYLHEIGVVHLDLKPKNILFTLVPGERDHPADVSVKLADFGDAQMAEDEVVKKTGTSGYMDPDMYKWPQQGNVDLVKADVFSFGMVFGEVLKGLPPMEAINCKFPREFYEKLEVGKKELLPKETPECVKSIVESCWNPIPDERPSFDDICWELQQAEILLLNGCT